MAITDKKQGVWELDEVYNKINEGDVWSYTLPAGSATSNPGYLYAWGRNVYGEGALGLNDTIDRSSPTQVGAAVWSSITNGTKGGVGTKTNGTLWSWGQNQFGALGLNQAGSFPAFECSSPIQIGSGTDWSRAFRTERCSFAIKTNGELWGWGDNRHGSIGNNGGGSEVYVSSPLQVGGTWTGAEIRGGDAHIVARKNDGTLWSWGYNHAGALGLNFASPYRISSPTQIPGTWYNHGTGQYQSYGVRTDGTLWVWGNASYNAFGNGINAARSSPVQIPGTTWSGPIYGYRYGALAIKQDGTLWGWGEQDNSDRAGCLGQNSLADIAEPTQIGTDTTWTQVTIGVPGCANGLKTNGTLWSWGGYVYGGTGLNLTGSASQRSSPTQVGSATDWSQLSNVTTSSQNQMALKSS